MWMLFHDIKALSKCLEYCCRVSDICFESVELVSSRIFKRFHICHSTVCKERYTRFRPKSLTWWPAWTTALNKNKRNPTVSQEKIFSLTPWLKVLTYLQVPMKRFCHYAGLAHNTHLIYCMFNNTFILCWHAHWTDVDLGFIFVHILGSYLDHLSSFLFLSLFHVFFFFHLTSY